MDDRRFDDLENENNRGANARFFIAIALITLMIFAWGPLTRWFAGDTAPADKSADPKAAKSGDTKTADTKTADAKKGDGKSPDAKAVTPDIKAAPDGAKPPADKPGVWAVRKPAAAAAGPLPLGAEGSAEVENGLSAVRFRYQAVVDPGAASVSYVRLSEFSDRVTSTFDFTGREPRPMPMVTPADTAESFRITRLTVDGAAVPLGGQDWQAGAKTLAADGSESLTLTMTVDRPGAGPMVVEKTFTALPRGDGPVGAGYLMGVKFAVRFPDADKAAHKVSFDFLGPVGVPEENQHDIRRVVWGRRLDANRETRRFMLGFDELITKFQDKKSVTIPEKPDADKNDTAANVWYVGVLNRFFAAIVIPDRLIGQSGGATPGPAEWESISVRRFPVPKEPVSGKPDSQSFVPEFRVSAEVTGSWNAGYHVYLGPKTGEMFAGVESTLKAELSLESLIDYAQFGCCPTSWGCNDYIGSLIGKPLLYLLDWIYMVIPNYGIAIILMVLLVRAAVYPISRKGTLSMLRMKELQPKIAEIQAKYADDRQTLGQKQMELYQKEGINPLGGCLPNLIQMPIWIGLWGALSAAVNLRHAPFVGWIKDLSGEDALVAMGTQFYIPVPICGNINLPHNLNLLPLATAVVMFINQKMMMPQSSNSPADQANPMNSKMMVYMFSGMFLLMLYTAPAGLNLYIMTSMLFGIFESWWVKGHFEEMKAKGLLAPKDGKPGLFGRLMERVRKIEEEQEKLSSGKTGKADRTDKDDGAGSGGSGGGSGGSGGGGQGGGRKGKKRR